MSYQDGMAALHLQMPDRVPRTEYSAAQNWELVSRVLQREVSEKSPDAVRQKASADFMRAWNYDFVWNVLIGADALCGRRTSMGHAVYQAGGTDYDDHVFCPFQAPEEVLAFDPAEEYGPVDEKAATEAFNLHYQSAVSLLCSAVNMTGIYITLISGLIEIFGWEMLLSGASLDQQAFGEVANRYARWIFPYFEALARSDAPVVMIHDDIVWTSGPFIHPDWYRKYVFPNYKKLFAPILESGKKLIYTSDGTYTQFIDDIAACGVNGFVLEPTTDMAYIAEKYGKTHSFIGNADTRVLLLGTRDDIEREVKRCMDIGKSCPGFIMAVGNHIPPGTPVENALYYNEVYEKFSRR